MRVLVTGSEGMLGRVVARTLAERHEVRGVDLVDGDLGDVGVASRICAETGPEWIIHCAAWTDVDGAESSPELAHTANAVATGNLVGWCGRNGCGLTYLSTDYVFRGEQSGGGYDEDRARDPINSYGRTKARGEEFVETLSTPWQIVRTSWLFGDGPITFPRTILRLLSERESLSVVDDQQGCPTYAPDLAEVLAFLVEQRAQGVFHATNEGVCTWFELARETASLAGADPERIRPCTSDEFPRPAPRPACSVLRSRRLEELGCPPRPAWRDALARYLADLIPGEA